MKKVIGTILGLIFVVAVVCGIVVGTYVFKQPSREGDSRAFINGPWYTEFDKEEGKGIVFDFDKSGEFTLHYYTKEGEYDKFSDDDVIAKGYFKVDQDNKKIKLLITPDYLEQDIVKFDYNLHFFTNIKYQDLEFKMKKKHSDESQDDIPDPTVKFIIGKKSYMLTQKPDDVDVYNSKDIQW